jgi:hypothetical protein
MSNDLEDFLRRAAARRQAAAASKPQQQQQPSAPPPRQQSEPARPIGNQRPANQNPPVNQDRNSNQQRSIQQRPMRPQTREAEPVILEARVVDSPSDAGSGQQAAVQRARDAAKRANQRSGKTVSNAARSKASSPMPTAMDDLIAALRTPQGIRQAILMREILDRPEHRW